MLRTKSIFYLWLLAELVTCQLPCDLTDQCLVKVLSRIDANEKWLSRLESKEESHVDEPESLQSKESCPIEDTLDVPGLKGLCPCMLETDEADSCYSCGGSDVCNKRTYVAVFSINEDTDILCVPGVEGEDRWHSDYTETFESGIREGTIVLVRGYLRSGNGFSVNVKTGNDLLADNAFHFNPRKNTATLVMNSHQYGNWQREQRLGQNDYLGSIYKNKPFEIKIAVSSLGFHVYGNAKELTFFAHRVDVSRLNTLAIHGEVHVYQDRVMDLLNVPKFVPLPETMQELQKCSQKKLWVVIQMTPNSVDKAIQIFFCETNRRTSNIHLAFVPRMKESETIRNSFVDGSWKVEEKDQTKFPFVLGKTAEIVFLFQRDLIKIFVNRNHYVDFHPRLPIPDIHYVYLNGADFYEPEIY